MKSNSTVYSLAQKPLTVFGLPPLLLVVTAASCALVFALLVVLDMLMLSLPLAVTLFVMVSAFFYRRTRQDHHYVNTLLVPPRFWRGRKVRYLIAGNPPVAQAREARS